MVAAPRPEHRRGQQIISQGKTGVDWRHRNDQKQANNKEQINAADSNQTSPRCWTGSP